MSKKKRNVYPGEKNILRPVVIEEENLYRTPYWRDYARLIHSPSFRRLQNKTQLFPGYELDFFRNRLTHSLEVAQIAKSIAMKVNYDYNANIDLDLVSFAGLAHDLGHPPFGHNGETALNNCMYENGGFEGNAQTLRILSVLEKKQKKSFPLESTDDVIIKELYGIGNDGEDLRVGLNLTYRTLASILKYDKEISSPTPHALTDNGNKIITKGYYSSSKNLVNQIKENVLIDPQNTEFFKKNTFKTIECQIMDIADDIAYSTYDLEDCLKGKFITLRDLNVSNRTLTRITEKVANNLSKSNVKISTEEVNNILYQVSSENIISASKYAYNTAKQKDNLSEDDYTRMGYDISAGSYLADKTLQENGYLRTQYTSSIVNDAVNSISFEYNIDEPAISKITIEENQRKKIEVLKQFNYVITIESSKLKIIEHRGKEIVESIFMTLADDPMLLPDDWYVLYTLMPCNQMKKRVICDFIAGMTDRYALEFYCRFHSVSPESIFKPF